MLKLRSYQKNIIEQVNACSNNVIVQADTGAGKTVIIADLAKNNEKFLVIAHRIILVNQISKTLSDFKIEHNVIMANNSTPIKYNKYKFVCSIDSLLIKIKNNHLKINVNDKWVIIIDEAHHVIKGNKWGRLFNIFKNSRFIGFTATPLRRFV